MSKSKYVPWAGEVEWRQRQQQAVERERASYREFLLSDRNAKCLGCLKQMTPNDDGKVVQTENGPRARCLTCTRKNR